MSSVHCVTHVLGSYRSRARSPCIFNARPVTVHDACNRTGQTAEPSVHRDRSPARSSRSSRAEPEQLPGPHSEPASARSGRVRESRHADGPVAKVTTWIGIDVSKAKLDVAVSPAGDHWQVERTP